ncbi:MAG: strawberry notch C-terminal domain-containing protein [Bacteroidota bacterium]|nr:strawberry notch C-terminal domain-containing protein [Bacteroidota bacterium]
MPTAKLYNTRAKRIATVKQSGKIITFKTPEGMPETYVNQILGKGIEKRQGSVKVLGVHRDSKWYNSMDDLLDDIEWDLMEGWHGGDDNMDGINPSLLPAYATQFINTLKDRIERGLKDNKTSLEKLAAFIKINDKTIVKELIELTIVDLARAIANSKEFSVTEKFKKIVSLYENQVNLSHRTSQSILLQQYSTPAPIGFLAGIFCEVDTFQYTRKIGFEPSAGNGLLTIAADPKQFWVNEIDDVRNLHLQVQGYRGVSKIDASGDFSKTLGKNFYQAFDAVITNPPFGKADAIKTFDGYPIGTLEHLMAIRGLNTMKDSGKAAIIIGNHTKYDDKGRVQKGANRIFLNYLCSHYYVADIIPIDGHKLYSRQGTAFNTRLILIDGRKTNVEGAAPVFDSYKDSPVKRFDELYDRVTEAMKINHQLTYKKSTDTKLDEKGNNPMSNKNPEVALAFQKYWNYKKKNNDAICVIGISDTYYSFAVDASHLNRIIGLPYSFYENNKTDIPFTTFPRNNLNLYLSKMASSGFKIAIVDELESQPKDKLKPITDNLTDEFHDLEEEMQNEIKRLKGEDDLGAPYQPASESCVVLNTVVPDSMEYETRQALEFVKKEVGGSIDEFVRQRLAYANKMELCKSLSAEQTDAVALAIYNIEAREQGMIIGDQTGIGKGRVAAAMIRYSVLQGLKPIFITEKPNLFSDIYRDLIAIGSGHLVPFIVNGKESKTDIKDEDGNILHQALSAPEQQVFFEDKRIPGNCDFVLATYSQFNSPDRKPIKPQFLIAVAKDNNIIMDESHNASGSSQTGEFLQNIVFNSKGVVFLSATFAKRPDNMPLYAMKTAIRDANMSKEDLIFAIQKGGVALQEILASQLVKEGQMLRRERSFEGIEVNYLMLDNLETEHRAIADNITDILRQIISFQTNTVDIMVDELDDIAVAQGKEVTIREGTSQAGVDNVPYFSKVFQVINQMLFAIKADAVADQAIKRLKEGKKPVIAFSSTMGSFIEQMENEKGLPVTDGDIVNIDFSEVLMRGLDGVLRYTETQPDGSKEFKKFDLTEFSEPARAEYLRIAAIIKTMSSGICISPIDLILQKLKAAGYKVAEVTGRKYEVQLNLETQKGMVQSRKKVNVNDAFREFNNNEIDVLMINQSGSTGASAHAIVTGKVSASQVKQRVMIVLQAELNINTEVQKRGRINRTGQILLPIYDYNMSAIPAEKRLMMMLQKKLKSLDANTTSNQKQSTKILDVPDFLNKYGDKIVTQYLNENPEINKLLGDPLHLSDPDNEDAEITEDAAHKVSGRVAVLSTKMQEEFYNEISQSYNDYVEYLKQIGEYDLEVETMNLEADTLSSKAVRMGKGGDSEFGTDSILEKVNANVLKKPFKRGELENIIRESLANNEPEKIQKKILDDYEIYAKETLENDLAKEKDYYSEQIKNITNEKKAIKLKEMAVHSEYLKYIANREKELNVALEKQLEKLQTQMKHRHQYLSRIINFFKIGKNLLYPVGTFSDGDIKVQAVFLGFVIDKKKKNPYAPSSVRLRFAIASFNKYIVMPASYAEDINGIIGASYDVEQTSLEETLNQWENAIKSADVAKNIRFIITGNLLQAFADYKGKLVSYTTSNGETKKGILMPEYWEGEEGMEEKIAVPVARALKIIGSIIKGNAVTTDNGTTIFNLGDTYKIVVAASKQKGGDVFLDKDILQMVHNHNFDKVADKMVAILPHKKLDDFLNILQSKFDDSIKIESYQFDLISQEAHEIKHRKPIVLLSEDEIEEQEELALLALSVEVEMEMEIELLRLQQAA